MAILMFPKNISTFNYKIKREILDKIAVYNDKMNSDHLKKLLINISIKYIKNKKIVIIIIDMIHECVCQDSLNDVIQYIFEETDS
jgi:hypothetical protein